MDSVKMVLTREHMHRNKPCKPRETISVSEEQAQRLERDGVARRASGNRTKTEEVNDESASS